MSQVSSVEFNLQEPVFPASVTALTRLTELRVLLPKVTPLSGELHFVTALTALKQLMIQAGDSA